MVVVAFGPRSPRQEPSGLIPLQSSVDGPLDPRRLQCKHAAAGIPFRSFSQLPELLYHRSVHNVLMEQADMPSNRCSDDSQKGVPPCSTRA